MAAEYLESDVDGLLIYMVLVDRFWVAPSVAIERAISQRGALFGLTPIDRRRLQWIVERAQESKRSKKMAEPVDPADDPRRILQVVQ
jgi:hypothetical protein